MPIPKEGINATFDAARALLQEEEKRLDDYLEKVKDFLRENLSNSMGDDAEEAANSQEGVRLLEQIRFVHCKFKFEIEIPVELVRESKPDDLVMTS